MKQYKAWELLPEEKVYLKSEVDEAIAKLKAKLESVQASTYADSVDAGMRERRMRRGVVQGQVENEERCIDNASMNQF